MVHDSPKAQVGHLALVLHAHLPYVRHPEFAKSLEERWFYEAVIECYLPILLSLEKLARDGVPVRLSMSVTPPLAAMLRDKLLRSRFEGHVIGMQHLLARERERLAESADLLPIALFYEARLRDLMDLWYRLDGDLTKGLLAHVEAGRLFLMTSSATHAYLPGLLGNDAALRAQLATGMCVPSGL
jgi:1,4-alpha-glucan branching enzyme